MGSNKDPDQATLARFAHALEQADGVSSHAAKSLNISRATAGRWRDKLKSGKYTLDPAVRAACEAGGITDASTLSHFWKSPKTNRETAIRCLSKIQRARTYPFVIWFAKL